MWLGIDFGTCNSCATLMQGWVPSPVTDSRYQNAVSFPTCAFLDPQGRILVGYDAYNQRLRGLDRYKEHFKRNLDQDYPFNLGGHEIFPRQLVVAVLQKLKGDAEKMAGESITRATISIPAVYSSTQKAVMEKAGKQAGFQYIHFVEEPVAAAVYYAQRSCTKDEEILMIYDLGGGTFDASLIQRRGSGYKHLAHPVGTREGAGIDFDRKIFNHLLNSCDDEKQKSQLMGQTPQALTYKMALQEACRKLKENLSSKQKDSFPVPIPGALQIYQLERSQFESMIQDYIGQTVQKCRELIRRANLGFDCIDRILLVGGSAQILYIKQVLEQEFHRPVARLEDPNLAVCKGAAVWEGWNPGYEHLQKGIDQADIGNYQGAISHYNEALQVSPNYPRAYVCRAKARQTIGQNKEAISDIGQALKLEPKYADAYTTLGNIYMGLGESQKVIEQNDKALRVNPQSHTAYCQRGRVKADFQMQEAIADWEKTILIAPQTVEDYSQRGWAYYFLERYDEALREFDEALSLNHRHLATYVYRAGVYAKLKKHGLVLADFETALKLNSNESSIYAWRGIYYFEELQEYDKAIAEYNIALKLNPNYVTVYLNRGVCFSLQGKYHEAISDFDEAIRINPNYALAYAWRGDARASLKDAQSALRDLNRAIEIQSTLTIAYFWRGWVHLGLENYSASKKDFSYAIEKEPELAAVAYQGRGYARSWLDDLEGAKRDLREAARLAQAQGDTTLYKEIQNELSQM